MAISTRVAQVGSDCVACGTCLRICPRGAIRIVSGVAARIDRESCVGCGMCASACPADVITITQRDAAR